ncbi:hypothetical protein HDU83_003056 [Entophlyctis luteolus]|nr:hypothetical protein HDU83_003056 [Entophlyctis luteolus]
MPKRDDNDRRPLFDGILELVAPDSVDVLIGTEETSPVLDAMDERLASVVNETEVGPSTVNFICRELAFRSCQVGNLDMLIFLINTKKVPEMAVDRKRNTLLHVALCSGHMHMVEWMLKWFSSSAAIVLTPSRRGRTPIEIAIAHGRHKLLFDIFCTTGRNSVYPALQHIFCYSLARKSEGLYLRVMKLQAPEFVKDWIKMCRRRQQWCQFAKTIGKTTIDAAKHKVSQFDWWESKLLWTPEEQLQNFLILESLSQTFDVDKIRWFVEECGASVRFPENCVFRLTVADNVIFHEFYYQDYHKLFNVHELSKSNLSHEFQSYISTESIDLDSLPLVVECISSNIRAAALMQKNWEEKLATIKTLISLDSSRSRCWSLPSLHYLTLSNNANILSALTKLGLYDLLRPLNFYEGQMESVDECVPEDECCAICLCRKRNVVELECAHEFCKKCLLELCMKDETGDLRCPLCRSPLIHIPDAFVGDYSSLLGWQFAQGARLCDFLAMLAAAAGSVHVLAWLIEDCGVNPNELYLRDGSNMIHVCVSQGALISVMWMLKNGYASLATSPNHSGFSPAQLNMMTKFPHSDLINNQLQDYLPNNWFDAVVDNAGQFSEWAVSLASHHKALHETKQKLLHWVQNGLATSHVLDFGILAQIDFYEVDAGFLDFLRNIVYDFDCDELFLWFCRSDLFNRCLRRTTPSAFPPKIAVAFANYTAYLNSLQRFRVSASEVTEAIKNGCDLSQLMEIMARRKALADETMEKYSAFLQNPLEPSISFEDCIFPLAIRGKHFNLAVEILCAGYVGPSSVFGRLMSDLMSAFTGEEDLNFVVWFLEFCKTKGASIDTSIEFESDSEGFRNLLHLAVLQLSWTRSAPSAELLKRLVLILAAEKDIDKHHCTRKNCSILYDLCCSHSSDDLVDALTLSSARQRTYELFKALIDGGAPSSKKDLTILAEKICEFGYSQSMDVLRYMALEMSIDVQCLEWNGLGIGGARDFTSEFESIKAEQRQQTF